MNAQSPLDRTVAERLEALRETLDGARTMPMSSSVVVNKTDLAHLLDELEESVARALGEAHHVLQQRDELVAAGEAEVEGMLRDARLERDRLVADTEVFHSALREADRVRIERRRRGPRPARGRRVVRRPSGWRPSRRRSTPRSRRSAAAATS